MAPRWPWHARDALRHRQGSAAGAGVKPQRVDDLAPLACCAPPDARHLTKCGHNLPRLATDPAWSSVSGPDPSSIFQWVSITSPVAAALRVSLGEMSIFKQPFSLPRTRRSRRCALALAGGGVVGGMYGWERWRRSRSAWRAGGAASTSTSAAARAPWSPRCWPTGSGPASSTRSSIRTCPIRSTSGAGRSSLAAPSAAPPSAWPGSSGLSART
jgi:hypothetical protein